MGLTENRGQLLLFSPMGVFSCTTIAARSVVRSDTLLTNKSWMILFMEDGGKNKGFQLLATGSTSFLYA